MLKYRNHRKVAAMENEQAVIKYEDILRISGIYVDYIKREIRVMLHRGYIASDGIFTVSNNEPVMTILQDEPARRELKDVEKDGMTRMEIVELPNRPLFTLTTTPKEGHDTRWAGDFRQVDIEQMIIDYDLLPGFDIIGIIPQ